MRRAKHTQKDSTKKRQQRTNKIVHGLHGDKVTAAAAAAPATVNNKQREKKPAISMLLHFVCDQSAPAAREHGPVWFTVFMCADTIA